MSKPRPQFVKTETVANALGVCTETVRRQARLGYFVGVIGGSDRPFKFNAAKTEKQLGLEPGSLSKAEQEATA